MSEEMTASRSATVYGRQLHLSGNEMNYLLVDQGILKGEPGDYTITDKGTPHAHMSKSRGDFYTYDPSIMDVIDRSPEAISRARQAASDRRAELQADRLSRASQSVSATSMQTPMRTVNWELALKSGGATVALTVIGAVTDLTRRYAVNAVRDTTSGRRKGGL